MIHRNLHPAGRISNMLFGACVIADGLVRFCSFGFCHTDLQLEFTRRQAKRQFAKLHQKKP